jgi:putative copper resistance protein D
MGWLGAGIDGPLVVIRAIHLAATAITAGTLIFRAVVVHAASGPAIPAAVIVGARTLRVGWICLAISVVSGLIWLLLEAASMSGLPFAESMESGVLLAVVNETQFGFIAEIRLVLAAMMAACLVYDRFLPVRRLAVVSALGLVAAIAWTGHAGSTAGNMGMLHLTADILHLFAAAIWLGGLVSLAILLSVTRSDRSDVAVSFAGGATRSFSTMGAGIVVVILATGIVNAWILVGSWHALVATGYGQLLMLKLALVGAMLLVAAVNRFWLTPRLILRPQGQPQFEDLRRLARNSMIEIALALMIFAIVGGLGTLHPAIHASNSFVDSAANVSGALMQPAR